MRAVIVDDEPLALKDLKRNLESFEVKVVGKYSDPRAALEALLSRPQEADVVFLDINMPEMNGLEVADKLTSELPRLPLVFVTAYDEYAVSAFQLNAIDYILKPLDRERLQQSLKRVRRRLAAENSHNTGDGTNRAGGRAGGNAAAPTRGEPGHKPTAAIPDFLTLRRGKSNGRNTMEVPPRIRMFGELALLDDQGEPMDIPWRSGKALELLAYLLHEGGQAVSRDVLLELLWPDHSPDSAAANLYSAVYLLRRALAQKTKALQIVSGSSSYRLEMGDSPVDALGWEEKIRNLPPPHLSTWEEHRNILMSKDSQYLGRYDFPWAETRRRQLASLWMHHALGLAEFLLDAGLTFDATTLLFEILKRDDYSEAARFGLMKAYAAMGQPAAVQDQYEKLKRMLHEEFDAQPDETITDWYENWVAGRR